MRISRVLSAPIQRGRGLTLGEGAYVSPRAIVKQPRSITIGARTTVGRSVELSPQGGSIRIGSDSSLNNSCVIYGAGGVVVGDDCRIANGVKIVAFNHIFSDLSTPTRLQGIDLKGIVVGDNVWIGVDAVVLDGATIGANCVIGAGAVVTKDLPPNAVAAGVPARVLYLRE